MTAPSTLVFRADKDKETGVQKGWKVFGPAELLAPNSIVKVSRKDGTTTEVLISKVSREFEVEGVICAYGTIAPEEDGD